MTTFENDPDVKAVAATTKEIVVQAGSYAITNAEHYHTFSGLLMRIKTALKSIEAAHDRIAGPIKQGLKELVQQANDSKAPLLQAEQSIKASMISWQNAERARAAAEQARADEIARKERERLQALAAKQESTGKVERAEETIQRAAAVVAPVISREPPKVAGIATRNVPKFEIVDPSKIPAEYRMIDEVKIGKTVRATGGTVAIPGVRIYFEQQIAAGRA